MLDIKTDIRENAILVGIVRPDQTRWQVEEYLDELEFLADTAGADTKARLIQSRGHIDPAFFIGRGKVNELLSLHELHEADLIIFDDDLSPAQMKNLENVCKTKIIDRSALILDIFAKRAQTHEARTQVELAQLQYFLPRLTRQWTHLSRQMGGIGTKGPGETQLEVDRRQIRQRIRSLKIQLEKIKKEEKIRRKRRDDVFKVALIGYTNVGKSTIMNTLTEADVFVEDRLFATLDPTVRQVQFSKSRPVLLIDTVGFIRKLPHDLVASFRSTLAEADEADLLLHIVDISHPQFEEQMATVREVLKDLKIEDRPVLHVFNKIDMLSEPGVISNLRCHFPNAVFISAKKGMFLESLKNKLCELAENEMIETELIFSSSEGNSMAQVYKYVNVIQRTIDDGKVIFKIRDLPWKLNQLNLKLQKINGFAN